MKTLARPALRSAATSISTMAGVRIRALTERHPIKPTSPRCNSAWQLNLGRHSTYRRGKSVQTTGTTSLGQSLILANARYRLFIQVTLPNKYCSSAMAAEPTTSTQSLSDKLLHRVQQQQQNCHPQGAACFLADTVRCCPGYTCLRGGGQTQGTCVLRVHKAVFLRPPLGFQPL